jgi:hypothetical protein
MRARASAASSSTDVPEPQLSPLVLPRTGILPEENETMKGIVAWLIGIPIPIIILLYIFHVF